MNTRFLIFAIILLIALGLGWWYTLAKVQKDFAKNDQLSSHIDTFMHDVSYLETDTKGLPINRFSAKKVVHYTDNDEYIFTSPELKILDSSGKLWQIHSAFGKSQKKETTINLWGNVDIIELLNKTGIQELELKTESLDYYRDEKYATTKDPLTIIQFGNIVKSTGAKLDFKKSILELSSKVEGQYVAEK